MRFLPLFFDASKGVAALVGSSPAALAKLRLLRAAGFHVRWFPGTPDIAEEILTLPGAGRLEISVGDPLTVPICATLSVLVSAARRRP